VLKRLSFNTGRPAGSSPALDEQAGRYCRVALAARAELNVGRRLVMRRCLTQQYPSGLQIFDAKNQEVHVRFPVRAKKEGHGARLESSAIQTRELGS
jgi:hypothetical protein